MALITPVLRLLRPLMRDCAWWYGFPIWQPDGIPAEVWLEAIAAHESLGDEEAVRYEERQDREGRGDSATDGDRPGVDDGWAEDDKSYGLFQIMGYNIRRLCGVPDGTPMNFRWACEPPVNLWLACKVLEGELRTVGSDVPKALARYNGGPTGDDIRQTERGAEMRCAEYVRRIREAVDLVQMDRA
jgi:hypothetical protein